jgi:hypothetical protein
MVTAFLRPSLPAENGSRALTPRPSGDRHVTRRLAARRVRHRDRNRARTYNLASRSTRLNSHASPLLLSTASRMLVVGHGFRFAPVMNVATSVRHLLS